MRKENFGNINVLDTDGKIIESLNTFKAALNYLNDKTDASPDDMRQALEEIIEYASVYFNDTRMIGIVKMANKGLK